MCYLDHLYKNWRIRIMHPNTALMSQVSGCWIHSLAEQSCVTAWSHRQKLEPLWFSRSVVMTCRILHCHWPLEQTPDSTGWKGSGHLTVWPWLPGLIMPGQRYGVHSERSYGGHSERSYGVHSERRQTVSRAVDWGVVITSSGVSPWLSQRYIHKIFLRTFLARGRIIF